jgi:hypothetical protein
MIMKFVYTKTKKTNIPMKAITISFFFNARGELLERSVVGMYRSLLLELLEGFPDLQKILDDPEFDPTEPAYMPTVEHTQRLIPFRHFVSGGASAYLFC